MNKIILKKPNIISLNKSYMCFDMHVHSEYSSDSNSKVTSIIKRAQELGIGIAITDHNEIRGCLEAYKKKKISLIPAIEARSKEGLDILFYFSKIDELIDFYKKIVEPNKGKLSRIKLSALNLIENSSNYNRIVALAHPFRPSIIRTISGKIKIKNKKLILNKIKTFEVINSKNFRIFNKKAIEIANKKNKNIVGGSDSHNIRTIGTTLTCIKKVNKYTALHILNEIANNNVLVIGKEMNLFFDLIESGYSIVRKLI